jgi:hypothetical protein
MAKPQNQQTISGAPAQDKLSMDVLAERYSIAYAIINSNPDLKKVLQKILKQKITNPEDQLIELQQTNWWQTRTATRKYWEKQQETNRADYELELNTLKTDIVDQYKKAGLTISDSQAGEMALKMLYGSEYDAQKNIVKFDKQWLKRQIAGSIDFTKTRTVNGVEVMDVSGSAEKVAQDLYQIAYDYGIDTSMSNTAFRGWFDKTARSVMSGDITLQQADDEIVDMARSRFPGMASYFDRGINLRTAADPWVKVLQDVLEVGEVDFNDDLFQKIINNTDEKGNFRPMSLYDARLAARKDPRWDYTSTAKNEKTEIASKILADFGFLG